MSYSHLTIVIKSIQNPIVMGTSPPWAGSLHPLVSHPTHGFYTWVGGGEAIYAADGTLTQHNSLKF